MLLEHLYRISLEEPRAWGMWIGMPVESNRFLDTRIDLLRSYLEGLRDSHRISGVGRSDLDDYFDWLQGERQEFPTEGWAQKYLRECEGDHIRAIGKFWGFLHEYLLLTRPDWFVRLNAGPLPSQICNGLGEPKSPDIRLPEHVSPLT
jgi:hypothetical protein